MKPYAFGVDIGGTTVKLGLFESNGTLLEVWEIPTVTADGGSQILGDIKAAIEAKVAEKGLSMDDIEGIGMGVPGPVGPDGTVFQCVNLGWGVFNVEDALSLLMNGIKVKVANDANVAALGEMWQGGGKGHENIVMVTLGTGVGSGIILNGKILAGVNGAGGELGHIPMVDGETEACGCGKYGCLEQYTSANGIVRITKRYLAAHPDCETVLKSMDRFTSKEIIDGAREGDAVCIEMVEEVGRLLGKAIATVCALVNPEAIVIGGGMSKAGAILIDTIQKHFKKYAFHATTETLFCEAELGNSAGIYGGVRMVLE